MKENFFKFLQQGVWASLSGGWYYDSRYGSFTNIFHLYTWLFLLCFPFILFLNTILNWIVIVSYVFTLVVFFATLKAVNSFLHHTFDSGNQFKKNVEEKDEKEEKVDDSSPNPSNLESATHNRVLEDMTLNTLEDPLEFSHDHDSDDVAGHQKLWEDINLDERNNQLLEIMKEDFAAGDNNVSVNGDDLQWQVEEEIKTNQDLRDDKDEKKFSEIYVSDETITKRRKTKPARKQHTKHEKKETPIGTCVSVTSLSSSSDAGRRSQSLSSSSSDELAHPDQPSTSKGIGGRRTRRRVGFRSHSRSGKYKKGSLAHVEEQPSTGPDDLIEVNLKDQSVDTENISDQSGSVKKKNDVADQAKQNDVRAGGDANQVNNSTVDQEITKTENFQSQVSAEDFDESETKSSESSDFDCNTLSRDLHRSDKSASIKLLNMERKAGKSVASSSTKITVQCAGDADRVNPPCLSELALLTDKDDFSLSHPSNYDDSLFTKRSSSRKKVTVSQNAPTEIIFVSSKSAGSSDASGESDFIECMHNFETIQKISLPQRTASLKTRTEPRHEVVRKTNSDTPFNDRHVKLIKPDTPRPRHRHPAGESPSFSFTTKSSKDRFPSSNTDEALSLAAENRKSDQTKLHLATDFADTSDGAVHSYRDSEGNLYTYTFSSDVQASTRGSEPFWQYVPDLPASRTRSRRRTGESSSSNSTIPLRPLVDDLLAVDRNRRRSHRLPSLTHRESRMNMMSILQRSSDARTRQFMTASVASRSSNLRPSTPSEINLVGRTASPKVKLYYEVKLPWKSFTMQYDRLSLMDLLDRNTLTMESVLAVFLAASVGGLGLYILSLGIIHDFWIFWLCLVMATSQYSLIKSVQPDSASPTHGHNRVIAYSRPVYFILSAILLIFFNFLSQPDNVTLHGIVVFGFTLFDNFAFAFGQNFMIVFILLLPVIFLFGLLPQINTFLIYICEQLEIHVFGGTASTSVVSSLFSVARSLITVTLLFGLCYGAVKSRERSQSIYFSAFCGFLISISYHLSRQTSSPVVLWSIIKSKLFKLENNKSLDDPAKEADSVNEKYLLNALNIRLQSEVVLMPIITVLTFALHTTSLFSSLQYPFTEIILGVVCFVGFILHYLLPQLRKNLPWLFFSQPILRSHEYKIFEITKPAKLMYFEKLSTGLGFIEKNILLPLYILNELTKQASPITALYGNLFGSILITVIGMKLLRSAFTVPAMQYFVYLFSYLYVNFDDPRYSNFVLIAYFLVGIFFVKLQELLLKLHFFYVYITPWQMSWGSTFHAFAQPFAVPHSAIMLMQAFLSSLLQAPFVPFLGSAIFHSSYVRPLKFWEKNYNTKRADHSNTRLANQFDRVPHSDHNNLNSVFYEHLTCSLQKSLAGHIGLGRWGSVFAGDCFILASDYINALVHIIEVGNGFVTFQLRGLEFTGTYCQQREVEAINEGAENNHSCCCCNARKVKGLLSFNSAFNHRWMAWQVIATNYALDGYSISDNNATSMLGVFDLRKVLITYMVKSIIYFLLTHDSLDDWIENQKIRDQIEACEQPSYAEIDSAFAETVDEDYDTALFGVSRTKFCEIYHTWIKHCSTQRSKKRNKTLDHSLDSKLVTLCFAISVLGRRALGTASNNLSSNLDYFLHGLHALFKGDFRITSSKDEWVFADMNLLQQVVAPGVRTALKLHQDHFACCDEYDDYDKLYDAIEGYTRDMVIAHEADPVWRKAILSNTPSLLALRRMASESFVDQYTILSLNHRTLGFSLVKINKECVRGLWAGQQSELIFIRNRNPERGSIQNATQVLRNMINSSCDQPIGYPIYVSPLTTSYTTTNEQYMSIVKGPITFQLIRDYFNNFITCLRESCTGSCNSGGGSGGLGPPPSVQMSHFTSIHRNPQPPLPVPSLDRGTRASDYATTAFSVPNLSRSERGSDSSSKSRSSYRPNSSAPNVDLSQPLHRPPLPPRLSTSRSTIAEPVNIKRSRPMSYSMNLPQTSSIKRGVRSISASAQL